MGRQAVCYCGRGIVDHLSRRALFIEPKHPNDVEIGDLVQIAPTRDNELSSILHGQVVVVEEVLAGGIKSSAPQIDHSRLLIKWGDFRLVGSLYWLPTRLLRMNSSSEHWSCPRCRLKNPPQEWAGATFIRCNRCKSPLQKPFSNPT